MDHVPDLVPLQHYLAGKSPKERGIETGRLTAQAATDFVVGELENELGKDVIVRN